MSSRQPSTFWTDDLAKIFDASLDAVIAIDEKGQIVGWNTTATAIFGWTKEEATELTLAKSIIPVDLRASHIQGLHRYLSNGEAHVLDQRVELTGLRKDGTEFPVELSASEVWHEGNRFFLGYVRDITEQKRLLSETAESRERLSLILASTAEAIYGIDLNGNCAFCNPSCLRMLGYETSDELLGRNMHQLIHHAWEDGSPFPVEDCRIYETLQTGVGTHAIDEVFWRKDGESFPVEYWSYPIHRDGELVGAVVTFLDITERLEDAEYRARMAALVDSSYDAIISKDLDGRITSWNLAAERVYGYSEAEADGRSISFILPSDVASEEEEILLAIKTGQRLEQFETTRQRKDGQIIPVSITVSPIADSSGRIIGSSTIERDISQWRDQENALGEARGIAEQAQKQSERALQVRGEFLANVSHELRTPMNAILGMLQLTLDEQLPEQTKSYLSTAKEAADSLLDLLNDILNFSRMESGKFAIENEPIHLRDTIDAAMKTVSATAFNKGLELACQVATEIPDALIGDGDRMRQIVINLIGNAIKFTEQGEVVLKVTPVRIWPDEVRLKFSVSDTGVGISAPDQKRIFDAFAQADATTTRHHGGVGLGLAICSELLKQMGGKLNVKSKLGEGSTFSFVLSLHRCDTHREESGVPIDQLRGLPVLVVDDNDTNRRILDQALRNWEMQPTLASRGEQALALLRQATSEGTPFPLVIVDALMPGMDGVSLSAAIREDTQIESPPIVLMLSSTDRQTLSMHKEKTKIDAYLSKPVSQSDLMDAIAACLQIAPPETLEHVTSPPSDQVLPLNVLLTEDTPANQKVISGILSKRGHAVTLANNGREAVGLLTQRGFDVVLMDIQMPIMDGYQATAAIRALKSTDRAQTPIIAMTAHAMQGDREKCLAAGMDAYIAKPIDMQELISVVERVLHAESLEQLNETPPTPGTRVSTQTDESNIDRDITFKDMDAALNRLRGERELLNDMITIFLEDAPKLVSTMQRALTDSDVNALERAAHSLKGLAANFDAAPTVTAAQIVEDAAAGGEFSQMAEALSDLQQRVDGLTLSLLAYLRDGNN